jgi:hypothetical protein
MRSEVEAALKDTENGKSDGVENIVAELWKDPGIMTIDLLWKMPD